MKRIKKTVSILLISAVLLLMMVIGFISTSATTPGATISIENVSAAPGSTVDVNVAIKNNPGVLGATLELSYGEGLILTNAVQGEAWDCLTMTKPGRLTNPCRFVWDGQEVSDDQIKDGCILKLTFKVTDEVGSGIELPINISYEYGDVVDNNLDYVSLTIVNGQISIAPEAPKNTMAQAVINDDQHTDSLDNSVDITESIKDEETQVRADRERMNEYIKQAKDKVGSDRMIGILNEVLRSKGVRSFSELEGEEKTDAVNAVFQKLHEANNLLPDKTDSLCDDVVAEMFDDLLTDSLSESSTPDTKINSSNIVFPIVIIVVFVLIIACGAIFIVKKKKLSNKKNNVQ